MGTTNPTLKSDLLIHSKGRTAEGVLALKKGRTD